MTQKEVKEDLRAISKKAQCIATLLKAIGVHNSCFELSSSEETKARLKAMTKELEHSVDEFTRLEMRYMRYIERLDTLQKAVLIDHYINAEPLWKTANKFGYTDRHLCRYINDAILKIAQMSGYENRAGQ